MAFGSENSDLGWEQNSKWIDYSHTLRIFSCSKPPISIWSMFMYPISMWKPFLKFTRLILVTLDISTTWEVNQQTSQIKLMVGIIGIIPERVLEGKNLAGDMSILKHVMMTTTISGWMAQPHVPCLWLTLPLRDRWNDQKVLSHVVDVTPISQAEAHKSSFELRGVLDSGPFA